MNTKVKMKVNLKINFSNPLLLNEIAPLDPKALPKPVPFA